MNCLRWILILCLTCLFGCGRTHSAAKSQALAEDKKSLVEDKFQLYANLSRSVQDRNGFIDTDVCDSLLYSGLLGVSYTQGIAIEAARDNIGAWHRRPLDYSECYPDHSGSTISRDMMLGLLWYIWRHERLDLAQDLFEYGQIHNWNMGQGDISRTYFTPALQSTLAEIIFHLGGTNYPIYRSIPQVYSQNVGYAAHLDILLILLRGELTGSISDNELSVLKYNYNRSKLNPLFVYAYHRYGDGDQSETLDTLLNDRLFPDNRLPTNHDRDVNWVNTVDAQDWAPAPASTPVKVFSGGDFLFVAKLVLSH